MTVVVMAQPWCWPLSSPWLVISPGAAWFIFFNAVVAAIAVMSSSRARQQQDRRVPSSLCQQRLRRSASSSVFLDQLQSFSLFSVHPGIADGVTVPPFDDDDDCLVQAASHCYRCSQEAEVLPAPQVTATQVSTVVPETPCPTTALAAGENVRTTARSVASSATAVTAAAAEPAPAPESKEAEEEEKDNKSICLDEAYAMVQQRRARQSPSSASSAPSVVSTTTAASWPEKTKDRLAAKGPKRRRRGREAAEEAPEGKAELNARAELFIRQFREELKLQRLNSLLRHTHAFGPVDGPPTAAVW